MFPVHQFDLHPHQRNEMQSAPHHYPSFEAISPQMRATPDRLHYQPWPCSSNYAYANPAQFHGCCEHSPFPGYYGLRSPYSQPPPHYYHGNYFVPPGAYPIHYIPPQNHIMEVPHYEYDKNMGGYYHCCGCPNNPCNWKGGKNVKIEEADPHLENKVDESLVPFNFRNYSDPLVWHSPSGSKAQIGRRTNDLQYGMQEDSSHSAKPHYPYPILWFPSNQIGNQVNKKSNEPMPEKQECEITSAKTDYPYPIMWLPPACNSKKEDSVSNKQKAEKQKGSFNGLKTSEISKPTEQQQDVMNGWFPFSMNKLIPSKSGSPGEELQQQGEDKPDFACPVFWMPYKTDGKESKDNKRSGVNQECAQRTPPHFEALSEMVPATNEEEDNIERNEKITAYESPKEMVKTNALKIIPVKQAELIEGEKKRENVKSSEISMNCSEQERLSKDGGKKKSPSPTRSSKLPPVCLRVDPIPKKKTANGSSRSPSPRGDKGKSMCAIDLKPVASLDTKQVPQPSLANGDSVAVIDKEKEQDKSKVRTIQVSKGTCNKTRNSESSSGAPDVVLTNQPSDKPAVENLSATDVKYKSIARANSEGVVEDKSMHFSSETTKKEETLNAEENNANIAKEPKRITLSEAEAACIIQSSYRGYAVRRLELLIKLKQVLEVKKKAAELKGNIEAFESSLDIQGIDKWRTMIGETIMSLLLKLDTIQGVHPSIKDFRRSVAKELVGLQEKVDHITQKKAGIVSQHDSLGEVMDSKADLCNRRSQEQEKQGHEDNVAESEPINEFHQKGVCQVENNHTPQESITEATVAERNSISFDPQLDAVSNFQTPVMPMKVADESEIYFKSISKPSPTETELEKTLVFHQVDDQVINPALGRISSLQENEVSELKDLEEFPEGKVSEDISTIDDLVPNEPAQERASEDVLNDLPKGVLQEYTDTKDDNIVKDNQGADEVSAENCLEPELAQLPLGVLDDNCESTVHLQIEEGEKKHKTDVVRVNVNAERTDGEVHGMNCMETTLKVPITSGANESLECAEAKANNVELFEMVDHGSEGIVQALEEEASFKSVDVSCTDAINDKSEVNVGVENEIPTVTTTTTPEICEEEELSFLKTEGVNVSGNDSKNSSNENKLQECNYPVKLSKSCDVEHEEKQFNKNFELQASGGAGGIDRECDSSKAKQGEEQELPPPSPSASEISQESDGFSEGDRKLIEENMRLREMMQKLIESGQDQLTAISNLSSRVKELEKRISKKKKLRMRRHGISRSSSGSSCCRPSHEPKKVNAVAMAM